MRLNRVEAKFKLSYGLVTTPAGMPAPASIQTECVEMRKKLP